MKNEDSRSRFWILATTASYGGPIALMVLPHEQEATTTGAAARCVPESHSPGRPLAADAVASPATGPWGLGGRPVRGGLRRGEARRRAPSRLTIKLVLECEV
eukprot:scaffold12296_cov27-Tisochrysis_lutea.AAC.5